jgi:hypothetical protein
MPLPLDTNFPQAKYEHMIEIGIMDDAVAEPAEIELGVQKGQWE